MIIKSNEFSRRAIITALTAMPVAGVGSRIAAVGPDPILAMIKEAKDARLRADEVGEVLDQLDERSAILTKFNDVERKAKHEELDEVECQLEDCLCVRDQAEEKVLKTKPRTQAGIAALLIFIAEHLVLYEYRYQADDILPALVNTAQAVAENGAPLVLSDRLMAAINDEDV
jgi:hypothetical protein